MGARWGSLGGCHGGGRVGDPLGKFGGWIPRIQVFAASTALDLVNPFPYAWTHGALHDDPVRRLSSNQPTTSYLTVPVTRRDYSRRFTDKYQGNSFSIELILGRTSTKVTHSPLR